MHRPTGSTMNKKILLLLAVAAVAAFWITTKKEAGYVDPLASESPTPSRSGTAAPRAATPKGTPFNAAYSTLVTQYAGRRIQFDQYCQANPNSLSISSGTKIMLDNRSGDARVISVGGTAYSLPGYGYHLLTISGAPRTLTLNCGASVNVGKILVQ